MSTALPDPIPSESASTADDPLFQIVARVSQINQLKFVMKEVMNTVDEGDSNNVPLTIHESCFNTTHSPRTGTGTGSGSGKSEKKSGKPHLYQKTINVDLVEEVMKEMNGKLPDPDPDAVPMVYGLGTPNDTSNGGQSSPREWIDASLYHLDQKEEDQLSIIRNHIVQSQRLSPDTIFFDRHTNNSVEKERHCFVSSKPLSFGRRHEWSILVKKSGLALQEIGVIGTCDVSNIVVHSKGIGVTQGLGARAVYGCRLSNASAYYGSWNENQSNRCFRELRPDLNHKRTGWRSGDTIKVALDLKKWSIKYYLNGKSVKKMMSVQPKKKYYPFISFKGNCKYQLN